MPRPEKVQAVAEIKERLEGSQAVFLAEYAGLSVKDQQALRRELRENGAEFKVVKMTLARLATGELKIESLDELLLGPTGLTFVEGDPVGPAKVLKEFSKDHETFTVKGGLLGSEFLTPEKIAELASIEPREVLLAKLAGAMKAPMANLAGLLAAMPRNTASLLQQLLEKKEAEEQAAAVEAPPEAEEETPEAEAQEEAPEAEEETPKAESADDSDDDDSTTEDDSDATVEAAAAADADADEKTEDNDDDTDESTNDDAGEE
ncbi:MAG: 50S ribosomal protein L10 [Acidimicrobiia bacterium]